MIDQIASMRKQPALFFEFGFFLLICSIIAVIAVNINYEWYESIIHTPILWTSIPGLGELHGDYYELNLHYLFNDILMAVFLFVVGIEIAQQFRKGGDMSSFSKASTPVIMTIGGILGPVTIYFILASIFGLPTAKAWIIPAATDIMYALVLNRVFFRGMAKMKSTLNMIAVTDDLLVGVGIVVFLSGDFQANYLIYTVIGLLLSLSFKRVGVTNFLVYLLFPGVLCWFGIANSGIHPALGLVPLAFVIPFKNKKLKEESTRKPEVLDAVDLDDEEQKDTSHEMEYYLRPLIDLTLGGFAFCNAGVLFSSSMLETLPFTGVLLTSLLIGKPLGIWLFGVGGVWVSTYVAQFANWLSGLAYERKDRFSKLEIPDGLTKRHIAALGAIASVGFTMTIFTAKAADLSPGLESAASLAALLSLPCAAIAVYSIKKALRISVNDGENHLRKLEEAAA